MMERHFTCQLPRFYFLYMFFDQSARKYILSLQTFFNFLVKLHFVIRFAIWVDQMTPSSFGIVVNVGTLLLLYVVSHTTAWNCIVVAVLFALIKWDLSPSIAIGGSSVGVLAGFASIESIPNKCVRKFYYDIIVEVNMTYYLDFHL